MNVSALMAIKERMKLAQRREGEDDDEVLAEIGLPSIHTAKKAGLIENAPTNLSERNCGNCIRWKTCTVAHRNGRVSPKLSACEAFEYSSRQ